MGLSNNPLRCDPNAFHCPEYYHSPLTHLVKIYEPVDNSSFMPVWPIFTLKIRTDYKFNMLCILWGPMVLICRLLPANQKL
jgi:hypothetical protein